METEPSLLIADEEILARWVFSPRNIDPYTKKLKDNFIFLRKNEKGISCYRYTLAGEDVTIEAGCHFRGSDKLFALALAQAGNIRAIDKEHIEVIVNNPDKPLHAEIRFNLGGELMKGIICDAYILDLFDQIKDLLVLKEI